MRILKYLSIIFFSVLIVSCSKVSEPIKKVGIGSKVINYQPSEDVNSLVIPPTSLNHQLKETFLKLLSQMMI